jgi:hypothetical protein
MHRKQPTERLEKKASRPEFPTQGSAHDNLLQITSATESMTLKASPNTHARSSTPIFLGSDPMGLSPFTI